jgi:hypothetical protein
MNEELIAELVAALERARDDLESMPFSNKGLRLVPARRAAIARINDALSAAKAKQGAQ